MSGTMEGLLSFQEVAKNHELPEVLDFDITSLEKYFDEKICVWSWKKYVSPLLNRWVQKQVKCLKSPS